MKIWRNDVSASPQDQDESGVCTIFLRSADVCDLTTPPGRQRVTGSSFPLSFDRVFLASAAHG